MDRGKPRNNSKIHIVSKHSNERQQFFLSDQGIPDNGIYRVLHNEHGLPGEVTLRSGQTFPTCSRCSEPVRFELIRKLTGEDTGFFVNLYSLPASDAPATHSDRPILQKPNLQQQREHDAAEAYVHGKLDLAEGFGLDDEDEPAA